MRHIYERLSYYAVPQLTLILGAIMVTVGQRYGFIAVTLPVWLVIALGLFVVLCGPLSMCYALQRSREQIAAMQAEAFHIPFMAPIVAEETLTEGQQTMPYLPSVREAAEMGMKIVYCPKCREVMSEWQTGQRTVEDGEGLQGWDVATDTALPPRPVWGAPPALKGVPWGS